MKVGVLYQVVYLGVVRVVISQAVLNNAVGAEIQGGIFLSLNKGGDLAFNAAARDTQFIKDTLFNDVLAVQIKGDPGNGQRGAIEISTNQKSSFTRILVKDFFPYPFSAPF